MISSNSKLLKNDETYFIGTKISTFLKVLYASAPAPPSSESNPFNKPDLYLKELELSIVISTNASSFIGCLSLLN